MMNIANMTEKDWLLVGETAFQKKLLTELYPSGVTSLVSDTFNFFDVITKIAPKLKEEILNRTPNALGLAKTVFRPDSGDPVEILCGIELRTLASDYKYENFEEWKEMVADEMDEQFCDKLDAEYPHCSEEEMYHFDDGKVYSVTYEPELNRHGKKYYYVGNFKETVEYCKFEEVKLTPEQKGAVECLWDTFGGTQTEQGYKVLHERVGLIYGDSITLERAENILKRLEAKGFASCNVVFGIGSYTYQYITRDTFGMAMKATYGEVNGEGREIYKDPITDSGTKKSARGLLRVEKEDGEFVLYDQQTWGQESEGEMQVVFLDGQIKNEVSMAEIRQRIADN